MGEIPVLWGESDPIALNKNPDRKVCPPQNKYFILKTPPPKKIYMILKAMKHIIHNEKQ